MRASGLTVSWRICGLLMDLLPCISSKWQLVQHGRDEAVEDEWVNIIASCLVLCVVFWLVIACCLGHREHYLFCVPWRHTYSKHTRQMHTCICTWLTCMYCRSSSVHALLLLVFTWLYLELCYIIQTMESVKQWAEPNWKKTDTAVTRGKECIDGKEGRKCEIQK